MDKKTKNLLLFVIVSIFFTSSYYAQTFGLEVNAANRMSDDSFDEYFCINFNGYFAFVENKVQIGPSLGFINSKISVVDSHLDRLTDQRFVVGISGRYLPFDFSDIFLPFLQISVGVEFWTRIGVGGGIGSGFEESLILTDVTNSPFLDSSVGVLFLQKHNINFLLSFSYRIKNSEYSYVYNNYILNESGSYSERLTLNSFLWNLGMRINF